MKIINFSHALTPDQFVKIVALAHSASGDTPEIINVPTQLDLSQPFAQQVAALAESVPLTNVEWQTERIIVILPSLNFGAALLLAYLHGKMGYFPACVRLAPIPDSPLRQFQVAELLNLQAMRDAGRVNSH